VGHARSEELRDLEDVLGELRALPGVSERAPGVFYLRRIPFLHFHTKAGKRWADAKIGSGWGPEMPLPFGAAKRLRASFLTEVRARYRRCANSAAPGGRRNVSAPARRRGAGKAT
jgi:hypothetical protein